MRKILFLAISAIVSLSLVACSQETSSNTNEEMMVVKDAKGEVEIPKDPKRIVDLSGNSDILSILGYQVIATANSDAYDYTKFPSYLEDVLGDAKILGYSMQDTMDVEAILNVQPDLIIISSVQEKMYKQLQKIAPTIMVQNEALDWKEDVKNIATIFNKQKQADVWLEKYDENAKKVEKEIKKQYGEDTTYLAFLASGGQFFIFSEAGFGEVLYEDLNLEKPIGLPEQSDISLPVVTYEGLAQIDADYIFAIGDEAGLTELQSNSIFQSMRAVKDGHVVTLPASPYFNQGYSCIGKEKLIKEMKGLLREAK